MEFVHPDDRERTERETAGLAAGEVTVNFTNRYATKDGDWRWIDWKAIASLEEGLIYLQSSATLRNRLGRWSAITTRLAAEQALAVHAQRAGQLSPRAELGARS